MTRSGSNRFLAWAVLVAVLFTLFAFFVDFNLAQATSGIDLRNRVVGARLAARDLDPYFHLWQEGEPLELLDPRVEPTDSVNRCTVPPTVLMLLAPVADWSYPSIHWLWFGLQWISLLLLGFSVVAQADKPEDRGKLFAAFLILFVFSQCCRLHVERGQTYLLHSTLLGFSALLCCRGRAGAGGFLFGLAAAFRLPFLAGGAIFLLARRWRLLGGVVVGFLLTTLLSLLVFGPGVWSSYLRAMEQHGQRHLRLLDWPGEEGHRLRLREKERLLNIEGVERVSRCSQGLVIRYSGAEPPEALVREVLAAELPGRSRLLFHPAYPERAEGMVLNRAVEFRTSRSGFARYFQYWSSPQRLSVMKGLAVFFGLGFLAVLWSRMRGGETGTKELLIVAVSFPVLLQYFLPAPRYLYAGMEWAVPALLLLGRNSGEALRGAPGAVLLVGLLGATGVLPLPLGGEHLGGLLLFFYFLWLVPRLVAGER